MSKFITYKGYKGTVEFSADDHILWGKIAAINDVVTYEAKSIPGIRRAFRKAVEDYLETCAELGKTPDKAFKGSFNVRVAPDMHRALAVAAQASGVSLNDMVGKALRKYVQELPKSIVSEPTVSFKGKKKTTKKVKKKTAAKRKGVKSAKKRN